MTESAQQLLNEWNWDPSILIGTVLFVGAYLAAIGPFRSRFQSSDALTSKQALWFLLGVGVILFALVSPLDAIGDEYLFTAHMLQHTLLMVIAPPLLLLGTPGWMLRPLLRAPVMRVAKILTLPPVAFLLFNGDLYLWHIPLLYEATLQNETIHIIEHLTFIATGVVNWFPLLSPLPELPRLQYLWRIAYLILDTLPMAILGWFFISASTVIYPTYAAAPHVFALYGLSDQYLGGLMMSMPMGLIYLGAVTDTRVA